MTLPVAPVMSVVVALKMKTALGLPCASRVSVPLRLNVPERALYTPGVRVVPPSSVATVVVTGWSTALRYPVSRSVWACAAAASFTWMVPVTVPGGNPVTAPAGLTPRSPLTTVRPVLVTAVLASTP